MKKHISVILFVGISLFAIYLWGKPTSMITHSAPKIGSVPSVIASRSKPGSSFNKDQFSTTDPASIWVIVNKQHPLIPINYIPKDLVIPNVPQRSNITTDEKQVSAKMAPSLEQMFNAAIQQGVNLNLQSGYRSYNLQKIVYNNELMNYGQVQADKESARPGYSEHQTGFAADIGGTTDPACNVSQCFIQTPEAIWLSANAFRFGFIIRYTQSNTAVTGYEAEAWHVRYVGTSLSTTMHQNNIGSLEQFFNVTGGPSY